MKNRSCCHTGLTSAELTVKQLSFGQIPSFLMSALKTNKSVWPSLFHKVLCASFVILEFLLELYQTSLFVFLGHLCTSPRIYPRSLFEYAFNRAHHDFTTIVSGDDYINFWHTPEPGNRRSNKSSQKSVNDRVSGFQLYHAGLRGKSIKLFSTANSRKISSFN